MKYYAIIVAGGTGTRMKSDTPKQFLLLQGEPVLMHTIKAFYHSDYRPQIILVMNQEFIEQWNQLVIKYHFNIPYTLTSGGTNRFDSVKSGLLQIKEQSIIAVHDAVRPAVTNKLITSAFTQAVKFGSVIPGLRSKDSVRKGKETKSQLLNREEIFLIQTPQVFRSEILKEAYRQNYQSEFTDDASVVEKAGGEIRIIDGEASNIKITFPDDLLLAEFFLSLRK